MPTAKKTPRNPIARSPLMRKGGVHEKSATSKRRTSRDEIEAELDNWRENVDFEDQIKRTKDSG